ncbi:hypothetical protein M0R45_027680 [Rubus argutus]|uniref:Uncharacterized protein n=1 Tax=Rubus argutus TaxID=59490 RepID=A0AAW1X4I6_RUBAR
MANSMFIPNHSLIVATPVSVSFSSKPIAPPKSLLGFSVTNSSPITIQSSSSSSRRASSFKSHLAPRESVPPANAKEDQNEKTVSEVEARIEVIENKQNQLVQKVSSISAEVTSGKEKLIRLQADFDNCRKIFEKERLAGARQDLFCVSNVSHLLNENTPQMCTYNSFGNDNMVPRLKRVSTEVEHWKSTV